MMRDKSGRFCRNVEENGPKDAMVGIKGFDKDLICRHMIYQFGTHEHLDGKISLCNRGLHFCVDPNDTFNYYPPNRSRYAFVKAWGQLDTENIDCGAIHLDSKVAASDLYIEPGEIELSQLADISVIRNKYLLDTPYGQKRDPRYELTKVKFKLQFVGFEKPFRVTDTQTIFAMCCDDRTISPALFVNCNNRGYAGEVCNSVMNADISITLGEYATAAASMGCSGLAVCHGSYSVAYGDTAIVQSEASLAKGGRIAITMSSSSAAVVVDPYGIAISRSYNSKVELLAPYSVGHIKSGPATVRAQHCVLNITYWKEIDCDERYDLANGTLIIAHGMNGSRNILLYAGIDIKPDDTNKPTIYTGLNITKAIQKAIKHGNKK